MASRQAFRALRDAVRQHNSDRLPVAWVTRISATEARGRDVVWAEIHISPIGDVSYEYDSVECLSACVSLLTAEPYRYGQSDTLFGHGRRRGPSAEALPMDTPPPPRRGNNNRYGISVPMHVLPGITVALTRADRIHQRSMETMFGGGRGMPVSFAEEREAVGRGIAWLEYHSASDYEVAAMDEQRIVAATATQDHDMSH